MKLFKETQKFESTSQILMKLGGLSFLVWKITFLSNISVKVLICFEIQIQKSQIISFIIK